MISKLFKSKFKSVLDTYYKEYWNHYWVHTNVYYSGRDDIKTISDVLKLDTEEEETEMKEYFLQIGGFLKTDDEKVVFALKWIISNLKYVGDIEKLKKVEYWQSAYETFTDRTGDCEDGAILMYKICIYLGVPSWKVRLMASYVAYKGTVAGHCYLVYTTFGNKDLAMNWYVTDWCYYPSLSLNNFKNISILEIDMYNPSEKSNPIWFAFNEDYEWAQKSWKIPYKNIFKGKELHVSIISNEFKTEIGEKKMYDKNWYKSKTVWGTLLAGLSIFLKILSDYLSGAIDLGSLLSQGIPTIGAMLVAIGLRDVLGKK